MAFLPDGFSSIITFGDGNNVLRLLEKEIQPGGAEVGQIDITTMRNTKVRTKWPKNLKSIDDVVLQAAYDPAQLGSLYANSLGISGIGNGVTVTFPDGTTWLYQYMWMDSFKPASLKEGEFPLAEVKFIYSGTNQLGTAIFIPKVNGVSWF